ncbi:GDSL esterase/lipase [Salix suchowensis]|nr:GDSL esterase/lipase [Salix suchowensis]
MALKFSAIQTLLAFIFSFLPIVIPLKFSYPAVFNFGDSNSDTGGLVAGLAFPVGPPNGETYFQQPYGRFCDGRLIIDFLMDAMGRPFLNPYLDSVGAPDFQKGCNFAAGGSTILPANAASTSPFSFGVQVAQFVRFKDRVLKLLAKDKKSQKNLPLQDYFNQGLYMFDMGQNDIDGAFNSKSEDQVISSFPAILSEFEAGIKRLYTEGARNFWVHNTGPLGCLPRIIATFGTNPSKLDQLHALIHITEQPMFSTHNCMIFAQRFKQPLAACCGYGGPPLNFDRRIACGQTKVLNGSTVTGSPCNDTAEFVNWDGNHYTEAANRYVSGEILAGNYSNQLPLSINTFTLPPSVFVGSKLSYYG